MSLLNYISKKIIDIESKCNDDRDKIRSPNVIHSIGRNRKILNFTEEAFVELIECIDKILENKRIANNFSSRFITKMIIDLAWEYHFDSSKNKSQNNTKRIKNKLKELKIKNKWVFFIGIDNLKIEKKFNLGKVKFYTLNANKLRYLERKYKIKLSLSGATVKERLNSILKDFKSGVIAEVHEEAGEGEKALEKALKTIEDSLNVLRLYNPSSRIGIHGEIPRQLRSIKAVNLTLRSMSEQMSVLGLTPSYYINSERLKTMKKHHFNKFSKLLKKKDLTELEKKLKITLHWYGSGVKDTVNIDKFIKLIISFESLLLKKREYPKKQKLCERLCFMLRKKRVRRKNLFKIMSKLYEIRNEIIHEGREEIEESDIANLLHFIRETLLFMIRKIKKFETLDELIGWIDDLKFG